MHSLRLPLGTVLFIATFTFLFIGCDLANSNCPAGFVFQGGKCVCEDADKVPQNGQCVLPYGQGGNTFPDGDDDVLLDAEQQETDTPTENDDTETQSETDDDTPVNPGNGDCGDLSAYQENAVWPLYGGCPTRNNRSRFSATIETPAVAATAAIGGEIVGGLVADSAGVIYAAQTDSIAAINPDMSVQWNKAFVDPIAEGIQADFSMGLSTLGADGSLYHATATSSLVALNPDSSVKWMFTESDTGEPHLWPVDVFMVNRDLLFLQSNNVIPLSTAGAKQELFTGGDLGFTSFTIAAMAPESRTIYMAVSPEASPRIVKFEADDPAGTIEELPLIPPLGRMNALTHGGDKLFVSASGQVTAYDLSTKAVLWEFWTDGTIFSPVALAENGNVYFGDYVPAGDNYTGSLYGVNASGEEIFKLDAGGAVVASPVIGANGRVYFATEADCIEKTRKLHALSETGETLWTFTGERGDNFDCAQGYRRFQGQPILTEEGAIIFAAGLVVNKIVDASSLEE